MRNLRTSIDSHGRLLIPAILRKELAYKPNDTLVLRVIDGKLHVLKLKQIVAEAQALISKHSKPGESLVDEFLQMRREEFLKEESQYKDDLDDRAQ